MNAAVGPVDPSAGVQFSVAETLEDIIGLESLAAEALAESRFNQARFAPEKFRRAAKRAAGDPARHGVLVARRSDQPVGFAYCTIGEPLIGTGFLITTVQMFYVKQDVRNSLLGGRIANSLLNGVMRWNAARDGQEVLVHLTSGVRSAQTHRFLKRRRFQTIGGGYAKSA